MRNQIHRRTVVLSIAGTLLVCSGMIQAQEPRDVIKLFDGTAVVGRLLSFDGTVFGIDVAGEQRELPRQAVRRIDLGRALPDPKVLYVPSGEDPLADDAVRRGLELVGLDVQTQAKVPIPLQDFDVVVLESVAASSPEVAAELRQFIARGGGCVMTRHVPWGLVAQDRARTPVIDASPVSEWVGSSQFSVASIRDHWYSTTDIYNPDRWHCKDPSVELAVSNPFGARAAWAARDTFWSFRGQTRVPNCPAEAMGDYTVIVAYVVSGDNRNVAAYAHTFGSGRVYWQALPHAANYPDLLALLVEGVRWTAKLNPVVVP